LKSKVMGLSEAVKEIPNEGACLALGGFAITRNPIAFVHEIIRQQKKDLDVYQTVAGMDTELLVGAGCVKKLNYTSGSLDRFGRLERINADIDQGKLDIREYSGLSLSMRFLAGAMGIPFIPTKALLGTHMLRDLIEKKDDGVRVETSPFDGEKYVYLKAIQPDIAVIHAQYADKTGNVIIEGPKWDVEMAKSAKKLYVTVEKIVSEEYIKQNVEKVAIPSLYTHAIIEVPFGAFPNAVYKVYDYDREYLIDYAKTNKNIDKYDNYLKEYVLGTKDHNEFLEKIGGLARLSNIKADPIFGYKVEVS
jgi:glutaconate CoA-transferase subunit A